MSRDTVSINPIVSQSLNDKAYRIDVARRFLTVWFGHTFVNNLFVFPAIGDALMHIDPQAMQAMFEFMENSMGLGDKLPAYMPVASLVILNGVISAIEMAIRAGVSKSPATRAWSERKQWFQVTRESREKPIGSLLHLALGMEHTSVKQAAITIAASVTMATVDGVTSVLGRTSLLNTVLETGTIALLGPIVFGRIANAAIDACIKRYQKSRIRSAYNEIDVEEKISFVPSGKRSVGWRFLTSFLGHAFMNNVFVFPVIADTIAHIDPDAMNTLMDFFRNTLGLGEYLDCFMPVGSFVVMNLLMTCLEFGIRGLAQVTKGSRAWSEKHDWLRLSRDKAHKTVASPMHLLLGLKPSTKAEAACILMASLIWNTADGVTGKFIGETVFNKMAKTGVLALMVPIISGRIAGGLIDCCQSRASKAKALQPDNMFAGASNGLPEVVVDADYTGTSEVTGRNEPGVLSEQTPLVPKSN